MQRCDCPEQDHRPRWAGSRNRPWPQVPHTNQAPNTELPSARPARGHISECSSGELSGPSKTSSFCSTTLSYSPGLRTTMKATTATARAVLRAGAARRCFTTSVVRRSVANEPSSYLLGVAKAQGVAKGLVGGKLCFRSRIPSSRAFICVCLPFGCPAAAPPR